MEVILSPQFDNDDANLLARVLPFVSAHILDVHFVAPSDIV